jgi:hypothetical protein
MTKWLGQSGLKVNQEETELYLFYKYDTPHISINVFNTNIVKKSKNQ